MRKVSLRFFLILFILGIPYKVFAAPDQVLVKNFPFSQQFELRSNTQEEFILSVKQGDKIKATASFGNRYSDDPYVLRTDIVVPSRAHSDNIFLEIKDNQNSVLTMDVTTSLGSYGIDETKSTKFKSFWVWEWDDEKLDTLTVDYEVRSDQKNLILQLRSESGIIGNPVPANIPVTLHLEKTNTNFFSSLKCKLPKFFQNLFKFGCLSKFEKNENLQSPNIANSSAALEISKNALELSSLLIKPDYEKLLLSGEQNPNFYKDSYNRFKTDPYSDLIPVKAKEVYSWSPNWNPQKYPENYVECVAFVHMVYNMSGVRLPSGLSHPINWPNKKNIFEVYKSGETRELPKVGDVLIWDANSGNPYGHVGILTSVIVDKYSNKGKITIHNANSASISHSYEYKISDNGIIEITSHDWKPNYWLRLKPNDKQ